MISNTETPERAAQTIMEAIANPANLWPRPAPENWMIVWSFPREPVEVFRGFLQMEFPAHRFVAR
jgi:hypothetical protein